MLVLPAQCWSYRRNAGPTGAMLVLPAQCWSFASRTTRISHFPPPPSALLAPLAGILRNKPQLGDSVKQASLLADQRPDELITCTMQTLRQALGLVRRQALGLVRASALWHFACTMQTLRQALGLVRRQALGLVRASALWYFACPMQTLRQALGLSQRTLVSCTATCISYFPPPRSALLHHSQESSEPAN